MSHNYRYVKQNFGCHCFYNDSAFKRYNRAHIGGDTLIFNYYGNSCGGYMPSTCGCGFWGGLKGFWGGLGAGLGMGLMNFGMGLLGGWMNNLMGGFGGCGGFGGGWMGNMFGGFGITPGVGNGNGGDNSTKEIKNKRTLGTKSASNDDKNVNGTGEGEGDVKGTGAGAGNVTGTGEGAGNVNGAGEGEGADTGVGENQGVNKGQGTPSAEDEIEVDGSKVKVGELQPSQISTLSDENLKKYYTILLGKLNSKELPDTNYVTLPATTISADSIKAIAVLAKANDKHVASAYNDDPRATDHYIAGSIDPETVKEEGGKLTWVIDCAGVGTKGNKYTVTQEEQNGDDYEVKVITPFNGKANAIAVSGKLKDGLITRSGNPYIS